MSMRLFGPTLLCIVWTCFVFLLFRLIDKRLFIGHPKSPDLTLSPDQRQRLDPLGAVQFQLETNKWHNRAVKSKHRFEILGVTVCSIPSGLVIESALDPYLTHIDSSSGPGVLWCRLISTFTVLVIIFAFRRPNHRHLVDRLRAEWLRLQLHCCLARVGDFFADHNSAHSDQEHKTIQVLNTAKGFCDSSCRNDEAFLTQEFRRIRDLCAHQRDNISNSHFDNAITESRIKAYLTERVGEQYGLGIIPGYFGNTARRMRRNYTTTVWIANVSLLLSGIVLILFAITQLSESVATVWSQLFSAVALLFVAVRSIFAWDSKAALYDRQSHDLERAAKVMIDCDREISVSGTRMNSNERQQIGNRFLVSAANFESLMASEAYDWMLINDRSYFDVSP